MKLFILAMLTFSSVFAFANNSEEIVNSPAVAKKIVELETEREVDCISPRQSQIHWMCTMYSCAFALDITCVSRINMFSSNKQIIRLSILGKTDGKDVTFIPEHNSVTEYRLSRLSTSSQGMMVESMPTE